MLYIQLQSGGIIMDHLPTRRAALDRLINYDFAYAEWMGVELKRSDLTN